MHLFDQPVLNDTKYSARYDPTSMANETYWDDFLHFYISKKSATQTPPSISIESPKDGTCSRSTGGPSRSRGPPLTTRTMSARWSTRSTAGTGRPRGEAADWLFGLDTRTLGPGEHTIAVRASDGTSSRGAVTVVITIVGPQRPTVPGGHAQGGMNLVAAGILFVALVVIAMLVLGKFRSKK